MASSEEIKMHLAVGAEKAEMFGNAQRAASAEMDQTSGLAKEARQGVSSLLARLISLGANIDQELATQRTAGGDMEDALTLIMSTAVGTQRLDEPIGHLRIAAGQQEQFVTALAGFKGRLPEFQTKLREVGEFLEMLGAFASDLSSSCAQQAVTSQVAAENVQQYIATT